MATTTGSQPCWLIKLPDELKLSIANFLDQKRDLYNLSLASKALEDMVMTSLYARVDLEIPQDQSLLWTAAGHPLLRPHVIEVVREICVRNGPMDFKNPIYNHRRSADTGSVDFYVRDAVHRMPANNLSSFAFLHRTQMSPATLDALATRHNSSLRHLRVYELGLSPDDMLLPSTLTELECHSVSDGEAITKLLQTNRETLQRVRLGQEKELVERYKQSRIAFLEQISQPVGTFHAALQLSNLCTLRELDLCGLDLALLTPTSVQQALPFCKLTRLSLESCPGSGSFLEAVTGAFHFAQNPSNATWPRTLPQLQAFLFRCETPTNALKETLTRFLASFTGLKTLSLLFENAALLESPSTMIAEHGPTLETLVLESRVLPRENLSLDTSRPFGVGGFSEELWAQSVNEICDLCPNLVELGTGFPWADETVRLRKTRLPTLKKLKTIHIRNFPESHILSQLGDYTIKEYAIKFVDWVFPANKGGSRPPLETLAIGPTLYESRWKSNSSRRRPPEFLRTHYFCLDFGQTRFGRWSPMITAVSEKCMEEMRNEKPLGGVFEQVWLK